MNHEQELLWDAEINEILREYKQRQLTETLTGPGVSFVIHIIVLALLALALTTPPRQEEPPNVIVTVLPPVDDTPPPDPPDDDDEPYEEPEVKAPEHNEPPTPEAGESQVAEIQSNDLPSPNGEESELEALTSVEPRESPLQFVGVFQNRGKNKGKLGKELGLDGPGDGWGPRGPGRRNRQDPIIRALNWLQRVQNSDGSWESNPAHTGLALLCFFGYGETPLSERYGVTIMKALRWLIVQHEKKGHFGRAYSHGIATYAIADGYAMTRIPLLRPVMESALNRIVEGQQSGGGFDYNYKKGDRWDLSVSGWQFQALKAGMLAGSSNPELSKALNKARSFCKRTYRAGKFGYSNGKVGSGGNMTGVGTVSLQFIGEGKSKYVKKAIETIRNERLATLRTVRENPNQWETVAGTNLYGWYYDTQAMFFNMGNSRKPWKEWCAFFPKVLVKHQHAEGYWETEKKHGQGPTLDGRVLSTTWCVLQLETPLRFLSSLNVNKHNKAMQNDSGIDEIGAGQEDLVIEID